MSDTKNTGISAEHDAALTKYHVYAPCKGFGEREGIRALIDSHRDLAARVVVLEAKRPAPDNVSEFRSILADKLTAERDEARAERDRLKAQLERATELLERPKLLSVYLQRNHPGWDCWHKDTLNEKLGVIGQLESEVERLKQELERAQRLLDEADEAHKRPSGDHAAARELYIEKADLDARLEQAREQGREEARKGIVRSLSGVAVTHQCRADDCERALSERSEALLCAMATRSAADIARNWRPGPSLSGEVTS